MPAPKKVNLDSQTIQDQQLFMRCISQLLHFVYSTDWSKLGYEDVQLRTGDFHRPDKKGHMVGSRHYDRCAADILLDVDGVMDERIDGVWITNSFHPIYIRMGQFWEKLDPRARWGGRFRRVDGNHFSIASIDGLRA